MTRLRSARGDRIAFAHKKWGPALLPAPTAPSEGSAGVRSTLVPPRKRFGTPLLDPGSPAQASLPIVQRPLARSPADLLDCAARRFAGLSTGPAWRSNSSPKTVIRAITARRSAALLGVTTLESRFAHQVPKNPRAASHKRRSPHPAPLPDWPRQEPESSSHCLPAEIGPSVLPHLSCRCRPSGEAGTSVPITRGPWTPLPSRGSEIFSYWPVDNVDIGNNNLRASASSGFGCRFVPSVLPRPSA